MNNVKRFRLFIQMIAVLCCMATPSIHAEELPLNSKQGLVSGRIMTDEKEAAPFATVYLKGTTLGTTPNAQGLYHLKAHAGNYTLVISAIGYRTIEKPIVIEAGNRTKVNVVIKTEVQQLQEVTVQANGTRRLQRSAFNAAAIDTKALSHSTKSLGDALGKTTGVKLRETGGVGADLQLTLDGMSGKHVKVFIDGVAQDGVAQSFSLNNIPANFAKRIEVYKGVVPVQFGTDAMGGVINIVTDRLQKPWHIDASYAGGSFNTHKWNLSFGHQLPQGWYYELRAFQNYSDNSYRIDAHVENFETGSIDKLKTYRVKRFNDRFRNEALIGRIGVSDRPWADRLVLSLTYSQMYKAIQNGVRQDIVYGDKHRRAHSFSPQIEYSKRDIGLERLDLHLTANYSRNLTTHVDTAQYKYNWRGEKQRLNSPGEQSYQHLRAYNDVWNGTGNLNYRLNAHHIFTLNHTVSLFARRNRSLLTSEAADDAIARRTRKHITGLQYRWIPAEKWNITLFGKHYSQQVSGPMAANVNADSYERVKRNVSNWGAGAAATWFVLKELQAKVSYERAVQLPSIEEMFGDNDLEMGDIGIKPESSHNLNLSFSYHKKWRKHRLEAEVGGIYRDTRDYIQRNITDLSGGKQAATYINYGKVMTRGVNTSLRYHWGRWLSVGGSFTRMEVLDNMRTSLGSNTPNLVYRRQMPNLPYLFADSDLTLRWTDCLSTGNELTLTYDNQYLHSFSYYSSAIGNNRDEYIVPTQLSHNLTLGYSINRRYHLSIEARNFTNEALYDNFSLQKPGRAFYGKVRVEL